MDPEVAPLLSAVLSGYGPATGQRILLCLMAPRRSRRATRAALSKAAGVVTPELDKLLLRVYGDD